MTATEIYRLKLRNGNSSSHGPDWRLYDDVKEFKDDLLEAMIEANARDYDKYREPWYRPCQYWLRHVLKKDTDGRGTIKVVGAEKLVKGEWVELNPALIPPRLEFKDESTEED